MVHQTTKALAFLNQDVRESGKMAENGCNLGVMHIIYEVRSRYFILAIILQSTSYD